MNLKLSESYLLHTLLDHFSDYIYFKDEKGRFLLINKALAKRYGLQNPSEAIGKDDYDYFTPEHADAAMKDEMEILKSGKTVCDIEEKATWIEGEPSWVSSSKMPLRDESGRIVGTFGISRDITERKNDQLALQEMTEKLRKKNIEYESDLSIAVELQEALIPSQYPSFPASADESGTRLHFSHRYRPSSNVGGDFFEVLTVSDLEAGLFFGDVMGHGVQAALVMAMIRALVTPTMDKAKEPSKFLSRINSSLLATLQRADRNLYATALYGTIHASTGECHFANAGQLTPLWIQKSRGQCRWIPEFKSHGPLGLFESNDYPSVQFKMEPGDSLLFYTDGIMDVDNEEEQDFGKDRILQSIQAHLDLPISALLDVLVQEALAFSAAKTFADDVCLLGVTWA